MFFMLISLYFSLSSCKLDRDVFLALGDHTSISPALYPHVHSWTQLILTHSEDEQTRLAYCQNDNYDTKSANNCCYFQQKCGFFHERCVDQNEHTL